MEDMVSKMATHLRDFGEEWPLAATPLRSSSFRRAQESLQYLSVTSALNADGTPVGARTSFTFEMTAKWGGYAGNKAEIGSTGW